MEGKACSTLSPRVVAKGVKGRPPVLTLLSLCVSMCLYVSLYAMMLVVEGRYKDASYYLWILAVERVHHLHSKVRQHTTEKRIQTRGIWSHSFCVCCVTRWSVVCL